MATKKTKKTAKKGTSTGAARRAAGRKGARARSLARAVRTPLAFEGRQAVVPGVAPRIGELAGMPLEEARRETTQTLTLTRGELARQRQAAAADGFRNWTEWMRHLGRTRANVALGGAS